MNSFKLYLSAEYPSSPKYKSLIYFTENTFQRWLEQFKPEEATREIIRPIREADVYLEQSCASSTGLYGTLLKDTQELVRQLTQGKKLKKTNLKLYDSFLEVSPLLLEYLEFIEAILNTSKTGFSSDRKDCQVLKLFQIKDDLCIYSPMEPALFVLLQKGIYNYLRNMLIAKGIVSMEEFRKLDLQVFLSHCVLYSPEKREAIWKALTNYVDPEEEAWHIITSKNSFKGVTPAFALVNYCNSMARKHEALFRDIVGQRYNGNGEIVLMRIRLYKDDPRIDTPEAYVRKDIKVDQALKYAKWVCESCHDDEEPLLLLKATDDTVKSTIDQIMTETFENGSK